MKNQKGITLVALVITIIVLLILAGVSISLVIGNNGVLTQASNAVVTNKAADAREAVDMAAAAAETYYYTEWAKNSATVRYSAASGGAYLDTTNGFVKQLENGGYTVDGTINYAELFSTTGTKITITKNNEKFEFENVSISNSTGELSYASPAKVTVKNSSNTKIGEMGL